MPAYEIRNRITRVSLGTVTVDAPEEVLCAFLADTGMGVEEFAACFGSTMEDVRAALDIAEAAPNEGSPEGRRARTPLAKALPPRRAFYQEERR